MQTPPQSNIPETPTPERRPRAAFFPAAALVFALSFLLTVYGPLELYFTNLREFPFDFSALFPALCKLFLLFAAMGALAFAFCRVLHIRLFHTVLVIAAVGFVCTYIQGMFLSGNLPPLDGRAINWNEYLSQDILSVLLWLFMGTVAVILVRRLGMQRMYRLITGLCLFLSAILLVTLVTVGIQNHGFARKYEAIMTKSGEFEMSTDENLIVFIVDAVDSTAFQELLHADDSPFADILTDFTYYPDTEGAYTFTQESIPFILTGKWYENQENFVSFTTRAMDESPLLTTLKAQNYRIGIYEEVLTYNNDNVYDLENAKALSYNISDFNRLAREELKLVWFKYMPFPLKQFAHVNMEVFSWLIELESKDEVFHAKNSDFYEDVQKHEIVTGPDKCFRFIHIEGGHVPFRYDKDVNIIDETQGSYLQNLQASMTIVNAYLEKLKEAEVYDNSAIVLMSDHGYGYNQDIYIYGRGNPLLAVKGKHEHHALEISDAPISYADLQEAYQRLLSGASGQEVFDARAGDSRSRRLICYPYQGEFRMEEYLQTGHASDIGTLVPTGEIYIREDHKTGSDDLTPGYIPGASPSPQKNPEVSPGARPTPTQGPGGPRQYGAAHSPAPALPTPSASEPAGPRKS